MDLNILHALAKRGKYRSLHNAVPEEMVDATTKNLLLWFGRYFDTYPDAEAIEWSSFETMLSLDKSVKVESMILYRHIIKSLSESNVPQEVLNAVSSQLEELMFTGKAQALLLRHANGEDIDITFELQLLSAQTRSRMETVAEAAWADKDILEYLEQGLEDGGFSLISFPELDANLKGLRGGMNVAVAAPTDKGKSSFFARIAVDIASQAKASHPDQPLLYIVNEGTAAALTPRIYQTALGLKHNEMYKLARDGTLEAKYCEVVGRRDAIRLVDAHGLTVGQIMRLIEQHNPHTVITDMTGRMRAGNSKMNDINQLEEVWNTMREMAAIYNFLHIGSVQVSSEGFDQLYPPVSALQNSKTGIQTTLDLMLMIGAILDPAHEFTRGISTPKNKLARTGSPAYLKIPMTFYPELNQWM